MGGSGRLGEEHGRKEGSVQGESEVRGEGGRDKGKESDRQVR